MRCAGMVQEWVAAPLTLMKRIRCQVFRQEKKSLPFNGLL